MEIKATTDTRNKFHLLDALRGLAALIIVIFHYKNFNIAPHTLDGDRETAPLFRWLIDPITNYGSNAVALFWVISGAVMMHVYGHQAKSLSPLIYANRRLARLYPLHFLTLVIVALLQFWSMNRFGEYQVYENNNMYHFGLQIAFASNWGFEKGFSFNGPIWSVSCEILAYLGFLIFLKTLPINRASTLLAFIAAALAHKSFDNSVSYCLACFFSGSLIYILIPSPSPNGKPLISYGLIALAVFIGASVADFNQGLKVLLILSSLVAIVLTLDLMIDFQKVPLLGWLGDISYSSYLWHTPIIIAAILIGRELSVSSQFVISDLTFVAYVCLVLIMSTLSYRYFEVPCQTFIRKKIRRRHQLSN